MIYFRILVLFLFLWVYVWQYELFISTLKYIINKYYLYVLLFAVLCNCHYYTHAIVTATQRVQQPFYKVFMKVVLFSLIEVYLMGSLLFEIPDYVTVGHLILLILFPYIFCVQCLIFFKDYSGCRCFSDISLKL